MEDKEISNMFEIKILPEGQVNTLQLAPPKKPLSSGIQEYNLARSEARRKKKEKEDEKKIKKLEKLHEETKKKREEEKKKKEEDKKIEEKKKKKEEEEKRERENLRYLADLDEKSENSNNAAPELREYISKNWGKTLVFGGLSAIKKEEEERKKEEEKEKKRQFMAAKRSCDLEFLLPYYENLIKKEVKKEEEKEKNKENEEKIKEINEKIYNKYNEKYKEIIKNNKGRVEGLYSEYPRELPKYIPETIAKNNFFRDLFARHENKKEEEVPAEFILADRDKKWFRRKATNKKYYDSHKPSSLPSSFFNAGAALGGVYSSLCEDMLAIKKEKEKEKEKDKDKEKEEKVEEEEESSEEDDLDEEIKKINNKLDLWRMTPKYDRLHNKKMKLLQRKKRREERRRRREEEEEEERSQKINEIMGDFAKRTKKEEEEEE